MLLNNNLGGVIRMDIIESDKHYTVHADLPGLTKDDIKCCVSNNVLTICAERKEEVI